MKRIFIIAVLILGLSPGNDLFSQVASAKENARYPVEKMTVQLTHTCAFTGEVVWFKIYCTSPLFPAVELSRMAYIELVNDDNASVIREKILLTHGEGRGEMMIPADFKTGIYHVLAYTNWMKNFGEGAFFQEALTIINPDEQLQLPAVDTLAPETPQAVELPAGDPYPFVTVSTDKSMYATREQVTVNIRDTRDTGGIYSVAVYRKSPGLIRGGEKTGFPEEIRQPDQISYLPDYLGVRLSGHLVSASGTPVTDENVILSYPGPGTGINSTTTDKDGEFNFLLQPGEGDKDVVFTLPGPGDRLTLDESFWNGFRDPPPPAELSTDSASVEFLKERFALIQLQRRFKSPNFRKDSKADSITPNENLTFYTNPGLKIRSADYIRLDSLAEYFWELVPPARFIQRKDECSIEVINPTTFFPLEDKPGIFVDGVLYPDCHQIAGIPVDDLDEIAVVDHTYYYRDFTFGGIVDIHTKQARFNDVKLMPGMIRVMYPMGAIPQYDYVSGGVSAAPASTRKPDLRYLLCWEPEVTLSEGEHGTTLHFSTSDISGEYVISVVGLTGDGTIVRREQEFRVR